MPSDEMTTVTADLRMPHRCAIVSEEASFVPTTGFSEKNHHILHIPLQGLGEITSLVQGHTVIKWQSRNLSLGLSAPNPRLSGISLIISTVIMASLW